MSIINVFSWREAIQRSKLDSTTRLVLLNLSIYMNERGEGCFPSIETQVLDTGLSNRSVITHLQKAADAQFLYITKLGLAGQKWKRNEYRAVFPNNVFTLRHQDVGQQQCSVGELEKGSERAARLSGEGGEPNDVKVVKEVHTNSSMNSSLEDIKEKNIKKRNHQKVSLADWEKKIGARLHPSMMKNWIAANQLDPVKVGILVVEFRDRMTANGNLYADFVAAFKDWVRRGFLTKKLEQLKADSSTLATKDLSNGGLSL